MSAVATFVGYFVIGSIGGLVLLAVAFGLYIYVQIRKGNFRSPI